MLSKFKWFLAPSILQAGLSFLTIPLATLILGPEDYGAFALITAITGLGTAVSCLGSSYLLSMMFSSSPLAVVKQFVSRQTIISLGIASVLAVGFAVVWRWLAYFIPSFVDVPLGGVLLSAFSMVPNTLWALAVDVLTLDGRARLFAIVVIIQSLVSAITLLCSLFMLGETELALFLAATASALTAGIGGLIALSRYLERPHLDKEGIRVFKGAIAITGVNIIEVAYQPFERNLLVAISGLSALGLYSHAQQYRQIAAMATKALARSIWPLTLKEANQPLFDFVRTGRYWALAHVVLSALGLAFAILGNELITLLTHGKFDGAGRYAAVGLAFLLVQNSARAHIGLLYAKGEVDIYARLNMIAILTTFICAALAIPQWGPWGALFAIFMQQTVLRIGLQIYVRRRIPVPFQDSWAISGLILIGLAIFWDEVCAPGLSTKIISLTVAYAALALCFYWVVWRRD